MKFDQKQEKTGFNKHEHYQFGKFTCPTCKSDDTYQVKDEAFITQKLTKNICSCGATWYTNNLTKLQKTHGNTNNITNNVNQCRTPNTFGS